MSQYLRTLYGSEGASGPVTQYTVNTVDPDLSVQSPRLYLAFSQGGGFIHNPQGQQLFRERGFTVRPIELTAREASYLTRNSSQTYSAGQQGALVLCSHRYVETGPSPNDRQCVVPGGLAAVGSGAEYIEENHPSSRVEVARFLRPEEIGSMTVYGGDSAPTQAQRERANAFAQQYERVLSQYVDLARLASSLQSERLTPQSQQPTSAELAQLTHMRLYLGQLAPVYSAISPGSLEGFEIPRPDSVPGPATESEIRRAVDVIVPNRPQDGFVWGSDSNEAIAGLNNSSGGLLESMCQRALTVMAQPSVHTPAQLSRSRQFESRWCVGAAGGLGRGWYWIAAAAGVVVVGGAVMARRRTQLLKAIAAR